MSVQLSIRGVGCHQKGKNKWKTMTPIFSLIFLVLQYKHGVEMRRIVFCVYGLAFIIRNDLDLNSPVLLCLCAIFLHTFRLRC